MCFFAFAVRLCPSRCLLAPWRARSSSAGLGQAMSGADLVNPLGHVWVSAVSAREHDRRLRALWGEWAGQSLHQGEDGVAFGDQEEGRGAVALDAWQAFALRIVVAKVRERLQLPGNGRSFAALRKYDPLRLIVTGNAGMGKSHTVRSSGR